VLRGKQIYYEEMVYKSFPYNCFFPLIIDIFTPIFKAFPLKVIIPVAGIGSKLRPHTHTQPKALVPVAGKPILSHIIDNLVELGLTEFVFIIGYLGDKVESFVRGNHPQIDCKFVVQEPREGIGHAVWLAREHLRGQELLIVLGDTIFDVDLKPVIHGKYSSVGVKKVENPDNFGVAELDEEGFIVKTVEKPTIPKSNLALVGLYKIKEGDRLLEALDYNIQHDIRTHNDFHLTDGLMRMISEGVKITTFPVENWYDCGLKSALLQTNAILLKRNEEAFKTRNDFENTIIVHPVTIAEGCKIANSIIGPNVSIGENATVNSSIVSNSIIGSFSELKNAVLHDSVVGSDASLRGLSQSLNIGDSTEIDFS
jgi:glucose-1-phosphate thymidylyltransferase